MQRVGNEAGENPKTELDRLGRDGDTIGGRAMPDTPMPPSDSVEVWGRRIGRTLGWTAAALLLYQLFRTYGS